MSLPATLSSTMDFSKIRKTEDGKVSVVDVIAQIKDCKGKYASEVYKRLLAEERVPECEVRNIAHIASERSSAKCGRPTTSTPIATAAEITEIIWQLPGASDFRKNCAKVCVRYLGGDESLVTEIRMNKRLQEQLREDDPSHPARLFGEAVEQTESEAVKRKQEELTLKKLDSEIQDIEFTTKRRRVENYVDCYASLEQHGIRMDDRNRLAVKDYVDSTLQPNGIHMIQDTPVKELCVRTFLLQYTNDPRSVEAAFGRHLAKLKKGELINEGKEPTIPKKQIFANGQAVNANMHLESDRALFEQAWSEMKR
jgi:hypothetical protein